MNTEKSDKNGTHLEVFYIFIWKNKFCVLIVLVLWLLKHLLYKMIKNIINKILFGIKKIKTKDNIISLISLTFSIENYNNLTKREIESLSTAALYLFYLLNDFGKIYKPMEEVTTYLIDDQIQGTETDTCGIF